MPGYYLTPLINIFNLKYLINSKLFKQFNNVVHTVKRFGCCLIIGNRNIILRFKKHFYILLVSDPNGGWYYNDDYRGTNPALKFTNPITGLYDIWIGSYDGSRRNPGRLVITEYNY